MVGAAARTIRTSTRSSRSSWASATSPSRGSRRPGRYDTRCETLSVLTCAQKPTRVSLIYVRTEPTTKSGKTWKKLKRKNGYAIGKQSVESVESVREEKGKGTMGRICLVVSLPLLPIQAIIIRNFNNLHYVAILSCETLMSGNKRLTINCKAV